MIIGGRSIPTNENRLRPTRHKLNNQPLVKTGNNEIKSPITTIKHRRSESTSHAVCNAGRPVFCPFPEKLHIMLSQAKDEKFDDIVSWLPDGRSFMVHQPERFLTTVMPLYFKQSKLRSFQRQLNLYGFARRRSGPDRGGYFHPFFLRDQPSLCNRIVRVRLKGKKTANVSVSSDCCQSGEADEVQFEESIQSDRSIYNTLSSDQGPEKESSGSPDSKTSSNGPKCHVRLAANTLLLSNDQASDIGCLSMLRHLLEWHYSGNTVVVDGIDIQSGDQTEFEGKRFHVLEAAEKVPQVPPSPQNETRTLFSSWNGSRRETINR